MIEFENYGPASAEIELIEAYTDFVMKSCDYDLSEGVTMLTKMMLFAVVKINDSKKADIIDDLTRIFDGLKEAVGNAPLCDQDCDHD